MNKTIKAVVAVIVCIWIFFMGFELGNYREMRKIKETGTTAAPFDTQPVSVTQTPTAAPATASTENTQPAGESTTQPTSDAQQDLTTAQPADETSNAAETTEAAAANDTAAILEKVAKAVNDTKGYKGAFTAQYAQVKDLDIIDCSVSTLTNTVNRVVKEFIGDGDNYTYNFTNGVGADSKGVAVAAADVIPPRVGTKSFTLTQDGVNTAEVKENDDGTTTYKITLVPEKADMQNPPVHNSAGVGSLDLSELSIITDAEYSYPGSVVEATVGSNGLLSSLHIYMPITAKGTGKVIGISGYATFDGSLNETWNFVYA